MNKKVVVIGWDGGTRQVVEEGITKGYLPTLKYLTQVGSYTNLKSTTPPATIPAWTSCFTGVNPGKHGYFDFAHLVSGTYSLKFTNSTYRKFSAVWNWLTKYGSNSIVIGVPGTYPPENISGIMVAGFDSPLSGKMTPERVHPRDLYQTVKKWSYGNINESVKRKHWHDETILNLLKRLNEKEEIVLQLLERCDWDLFITVFNESDTVSHHYWMFWDESSPRYIKSNYKDAIPLIYKKLDEILAKILKITEKKDVIFLVVSDHGFQPADKIAVHINNWLLYKGYLKYSSTNDFSIKIRDALLRFFSPAVASKIFYSYKHYAEKLESIIRFSGIDWNRTVAYSEELDYFPSIRINLKNREPMGIVPEEDYYEFVSHLCKELISIPYVKNAHFRESIYAGPYVDNAPDIILELSGENRSRASVLRARGGPIFEEITPNRYFGARGKGLNGQHHPEGILFISEKVDATEVKITDIAPTIASILKIPVPPLDGKPLMGEIIIDNEYQELLQEEESLSPYEEWLILRQMKELGYWQ
ncbi:MAG: alkaline phosphatase family protein [Candidatus Hydrogenedentes bacterium]|nr:alkaline phosphatase family protein [Candidatus Hydrogenedentota bacterium]